MQLLGDVGSKERKSAQRQKVQKVKVSDRTDYNRIDSRKVLRSIFETVLYEMEGVAFEKEERVVNYSSCTEKHD